MAIYPMKMNWYNFFSWKTEYKIEIDPRLKPFIWELWSDVANWKDWDDVVENSSLEGPFEVGIKGIVKIHGRPMAPFTMTEVTPMVSWTKRSFFFLGFMDIEHFFEEHDGKTFVVHRGVIGGLLFLKYKKLIGPKLQGSLAPAMEKLIRMSKKLY